MYPAIALLLLIALSVSPMALAEESKQKAPSIGIATMDKEGTIHMRLRSGPSGEASFEYKKTNPEYNKILKHLGDMKPGDVKSVPPFPAEAKKH